MVVFYDRNLGMALGSFDIGCDLLQELQLCGLTDSVTVIEDSFEFKDQSMLNEMIQLANGILGDCPGGEINPCRTGLL